MKFLPFSLYRKDSVVTELPYQIRSATCLASSLSMGLTNEGVSQESVEVCMMNNYIPNVFFINLADVRALIRCYWCELKKLSSYFRQEISHFHVVGFYYLLIL